MDINYRFKYKPEFDLNNTILLSRHIEWFFLSKTMNNCIEIRLYNNPVLNNLLRFFLHCQSQSVGRTKKRWANDKNIRKYYGKTSHTSLLQAGIKITPSA